MLIVQWQLGRQTHSEPMQWRCRWVAKSLGHVILTRRNWFQHILMRHPDMTLPYLTSLLTEPDVIFKPSRSAHEWYFQKEINGMEYRAVVARDVHGNRQVVTAYRIIPREYFDWHTQRVTYVAAHEEARAKLYRWRVTGIFGNIDLPPQKEAMA